MPRDRTGAPEGQVPGVVLVDGRDAQLITAKDLSVSLVGQIREGLVGAHTISAASQR